MTSLSTQLTRITRGYPTNSRMTTMVSLRHRFCWTVSIPLLLSSHRHAVQAYPSIPVGMAVDDTDVFMSQPPLLDPGRIDLLSFSSTPITTDLPEYPWTISDIPSSRPIRRIKRRGKLSIDLKGNQAHPNDDLDLDISLTMDPSSTLRLLQAGWTFGTSIASAIVGSAKLLAIM